MPLFKIPNQPLFPDENNPTDELCSADYCHLVASDDSIYAQWYQTPCGINEACDPDFTDVTYNNVLTENFSVCPGTWTGIVTSPTYGWRCEPAGTPVKVQCYPDTGTSPAPSYTIGYNGGGAMLTQYKTFRVSFTIADRTQGFVQCFLGAVVANESSAVIGDNGDYVIYINYTQNPAAFDDISFIATEYFDGSIDDVVVDEVVMTCWNNGSATWDMDGTGGACKTDTTLSGDLDDGAGGNYLTINKYYKLEVVISGYTSGTLTPKVGGTSGDVIEGNGTFTRYIVAGASTYVAFTPSTDFIGCVESIDIRELKYTGDYAVAIVDADLNAEIETVTDYITFYNQYVTFCMKPSDIDLAEGCYRITINDTCELQYGEYVDNGGFDGGSGSAVDGWTPINGIQWDFSGSDCEIIYASGYPSNTPFMNNTYQPLFQEDSYVGGGDSNYRISFDLKSIVPTVGLASEIKVGVRIGYQTTAIYYFGTADGTPPYTASYDVVVPAPYVAPTEPPAPRFGRVQVFGNFTNGSEGSVFIDNVSVTKLSPYQATYISDCFRVVSSPPNLSKLLIGTCDTEQFGFEFANSGFKLLHRVECRGFNPSWTMSQDDYTFSTGSTERNYAEIEKFWELFIEACPATTHGTIALQINCDNFEIGDTETDTKTYITSPGDYTPEWDRTGASDIAPSRLQLKIKSEGMLFNRKC